MCWCRPELRTPWCGREECHPPVKKMKSPQLKKPVIMTFTKKELNPIDVQLQDIDITDIAHALALCNRFAGHTKKPISVAQHSVYVSRLCGGFGDLALQGLLHDASEAYLGDVTKWLKNTPEMKGYRDVEERTQRMIFKKFGVPTKLDPKVEWADRLMVRWEGLQGFGKEFKIDHPAYPHEISEKERAAIGNWTFWTWHMAEEIFLDQFRLCMY